MYGWEQCKKNITKMALLWDLQLSNGNWPPFCKGLVGDHCRDCSTCILAYMDSRGWGAPTPCAQFSSNLFSSNLLSSNFFRPIHFVQSYQVRLGQIRFSQYRLGLVSIGQVWLVQVRLGLDKNRRTKIGWTKSGSTRPPHLYIYKYIYSRNSPLRRPFPSPPGVPPSAEIFFRAPWVPHLGSLRRR